MNIDERIEALTHSVELLASFHKDSEERMAKFHKENEERMAKLLDTMIRLGNIVIAHERRIEDLEGK